MRIMGLDVGDKTIGVAVSDALGLTAQGLETIKRTGKKADFRRLRDIISEKEVTKTVVGLPKNMNGTIGSQGEKVLEFVEEFKKRFPKHEVIMWDERLTTVAAEKTLISGQVGGRDRKKVIDMVAATFILQGFLDQK